MSLIAHCPRNIFVENVVRCRSRDITTTLTRHLANFGKTIADSYNNNTTTTTTTAINTTSSMPPVLIHPSDMLSHGLLFAKVDEEAQGRMCEAANVEQFKSIYGKHPKHLARAFRDLQTYGLLDVNNLGIELSFKGFLLGNNYLKTYLCLNLQRALFPGMSKKKIGELRWIFIHMLAGLKQHKIKMPTPEEWDAAKGQLSVDGTHAKTNEPRDNEMRRNPKNFSYKNNFAGLNYQIAVNIFKEQIAYCNTGDPGSVHDMTAMRNEFIGLLPEGARVVADSGYTGKSALEKSIFAVKNSFDTAAVKQFKKRARSRQETVNKRLKEYQCMKSAWTDGVALHSVAFAACIVLVQYAMEDTSSTGEPLLTV